MLERDQYKEDSTIKYIPNFSLQKFQQHILGNSNSFYKLMLTQAQAERWNSRINYTNNIVVGLFTLALIPTIFFRSIPVLKSFKSKKARVFWSMGFILIPPNIALQYLTTKNKAQIAQSYSINMAQFMKYRMNGDITAINPEIKWAEF